MSVDVPGSVEMRYFPVSDEKPASYCRRRVRECDVYIGLVGFRYGSSADGLRGDLPQTGDPVEDLRALVEDLHDGRE
jgi:hypothetical protein